MTEHTGITKHGLVSEGAAFITAPDGQPARLRWNSVGGTGRALCACGAMSEELPSANQRKHWHRRHKNDIDNKDTDHG